MSSPIERLRRDFDSSDVGTCFVDRADLALLLKLAKAVMLYRCCGMSDDVTQHLEALSDITDALTKEDA